MYVYKFLLPTLVLTLSLGLVGCGDGDDDASGDGSAGGGAAAAIEPADTAQGTLDALGRAVVEGQADAIDGLIVGGGDIETAMESIMEAEAKTERFKQKVREAYGEEGTEKLENATGALAQVTSDPFDARSTPASTPSRSTVTPRRRRRATGPTPTK